MLLLKALDPDLRDAVGGSSLTVGRLSSNGLVIDRGDVSSLHALLQWRRDGWDLRDLDSRNGTFLKGTRIEGWTRIRAGDRIRFGRTSEYLVTAARAPGPDADPGLSRPTGVSGDAAPLRIRLHQKTDGGDLFVVVGSRAEHAELGVKFDLLLALGLARIAEGDDPDGGWLDDETLRRQIWGRQAEDKSEAALSKLIHDTRDELERLGVDRHLVQKRRGTTRIKLDALQLEIE